jgi:Tfp pilus assembly protein PilF
LLSHQAQRGDARSLLQLAWLQLARGDREAAQRSLGAFLRAAPELHDESAELAAALRR